MKRKIDELGRIVIPKEWRNELGIEANQELEFAKVGSKIIITIPTGMKTKEEVEKLYKEMSKIKETEYNLGFLDALKEVLKKEGK